MTGRTVRAPYIETPLIESAPLSKAVGCRVFLKLENLQPCGSFKSRGPGNVVYQHVLQAEQSGSPKSVHFFCSSAGNAGLGCVTSATSLGYPSTIVVPVTTKPRVIDQLKAAGASEVIQVGESWFYADEHLRNTILPAAKANGVEAVYVHPFENELIYQGNSKIIHEIKQQLQTGYGVDDQPAAVICSVGGGGLFTGLQQGLQSPETSWSSVSLVGLETTGAASLSASLKANAVVTLPSIDTIATSLGAVRIGQATFEAAQKPNVSCIVLSDADAAMGVWRFADDHRMLVEPACGVSLAVCYKEGLLKQVLDPENKGGLGPDSIVVIIVCGGSGMTSQMVQEYRETYAEEADRGTMKEGVPSRQTVPA